MAPADCLVAFPALTADIVAFAEAASPSSDESSRRQTALEVITAAVKQEWPDAEVRVFGSSACGTTLPSSDVDVAVNGPLWIPPPPDATSTSTSTFTATTADATADADAANLAIKPAMIRAARRLADRLRAMARGGSPIGHVLPITRARVPVVRTKIRSVGVDVVFGRELAYVVTPCSPNSSLSSHRRFLCTCYLTNVT